MIRKAADLSQFWSCLSKNNSTLQDMVVLDFLASSNGVPVTSDEKVHTCTLYSVACACVCACECTNRNTPGCHFVHMTRLTYS